MMYTFVRTSGHPDLTPGHSNLTSGYPEKLWYTYVIPRTAFILFTLLNQQLTVIHALSQQVQACNLMKILDRQLTVYERHQLGTPSSESCFLVGSERTCDLFH
jgi:hypothetical protein